METAIELESETRNPNIEIRNPKQAQMTESEMTETPRNQRDYEKIENMSIIDIRTFEF